MPACFPKLLHHFISSSARCESFSVLLCKENTSSSPPTLKPSKSTGHFWSSKWESYQVVNRQLVLRCLPEQLSSDTICLIKGSIPRCWKFSSQEWHPSPPAPNFRCQTEGPQVVLPALLANCKLGSHKPFSWFWLIFKAAHRTHRDMFSGLLERTLPRTQMRRHTGWGVWGFHDFLASPSGNFMVSYLKALETAPLSGVAATRPISIQKVIYHWEVFKDFSSLPRSWNENQIRIFLTLHFYPLWLWCLFYLSCVWCGIPLRPGFSSSCW